MATANPNDAKIICKNQKCPIPVFKWNELLVHVIESKTCKMFYSREELEMLLILCAKPNSEVYSPVSFLKPH